jgi:hypothetical protein
MNRLFLLLAFFATTALGQATGQNTPCYWSATLARCFPATGFELDNNKQIRFRELTTNGTDYVRLIGPSSLTSSPVITLPEGTGTVLISGNAASATSYTTSGTGGLGFFNAIAQSSTPSAPSNGVSFAASASGNSPTFTNQSSNTLTLDMTSMTAPRQMTIPNATGTLGLNPMTANGDIMYGTASGATTSRLAPGTSVQVLHSGTTPSWSAVSASADITGLLPLANGGCNKLQTASAGALIYLDSDSCEKTAVGTASMWALSGGTGAPTFSNTTTTAKAIDGTADAVQLLVQGNLTQTSNPSVLLVEKSDGTDLLSVSDAEVTRIGAGAETFRDTNAGADSTNVTAAITRDSTFGSIMFGKGSSAGTTSTINGVFKNTSGNQIRGAAIFFNNTTTDTAGAETGNLEFYTKPAGTAEAKAATISSEGYITHPLNINARVSRITSTQTVTTGIAATVLFNSKDREIGGTNYDTSTGIFTVPTSGDGVYIFCTGVQLTATSITRIQVSLIINGGSYVLYDNLGASGAQADGGGCMPFYVAAAATAKISVFATGTGTLLVQNGAGASWFSFAKIQ